MTSGDTDDKLYYDFGLKRIAVCFEVLEVVSMNNAEPLNQNILAEVV